MQILQKLKNPVIWLIGIAFKLTLKKIFFRSISNDDFKRLFSYTLELLPNETFISIIKLFLSLFMSKSSDILNLNVLNDAVTHSIPQEQRFDILSRLRFLFIILVLGNIIKRTLFLIKSIIILPFKLGVYGFIASLFGLKPDYLLSFFDIFKFNLPSWTYNKLVDLHFSWMSWFKDTLQINSINIDSDNAPSLPKLKRQPVIPDPEPIVESKPETYFYLTKMQWLYVSISSVFLFAAYFGYTGGIPFTKTFEWNSDSNSSSDSNSGTGDIDINVNRERPKTWTESLQSIGRKLNPFSREYFLNRFNPFINDTPQDVNVAPLPPQDLPLDPVEREAFVSERFTNRFVNSFYSRPDEEPSRWNIIGRVSRWWSSNNDTELTIMEQLEKQGHLNETDREQLRKEYINSKNSSPIHIDPKLAAEYDRLFPKVIDNITASTSYQNTEPLYDPDSYAKFTALDNASTDTIRQSNIPSSNINTDNENNDLSSDITASELTPLTKPESPTESEHTYPPRPLGKQKVKINFSALSETPFARGFNETVDLGSIHKGSVMFSSRVLSNIDKNKDKDDFNGDWNN